MLPNHSLYHESNLGRFRDPSPNMVLDSYYPDIVDSGVHTSSGESSRLSWGSVQVFLFFSINIILSFIYYLAESISILPLRITTQHDNSELPGKLFCSSTS